MASTSSTTLFISSSSAFVDAKAPRQTSAASPQCVTLPTLPAPAPPIQSHKRASKITSYCLKIPRNVRAMATGEAPAEVAGTDLPDVDLPDVAKTIQEAWDKLEDKYAVTSLAVAVVVALWVSTGMISAIDRLPLVPGVLELVGIGYTGWFAYKNLIFKPEREELIEKIKDTYKNVIGTS